MGVGSKYKSQTASRKLKVKSFYWGCISGVLCLVSGVWPLVSILFSGCENKPYYTQTQLLMGTLVEVTCQNKSAIKEAFSVIKRIEVLANNFRPDSELSLLNRQGQITASPELFDLVKESVKYYKLSGGAFDATVLPLVSFWKEKIQDFRNGAREIIFPEDSDIKNLLGLVGSNKIELDEKNLVIKFNLPGVTVDLGGIAKGYAVDLAVRRLKELGVNSALVNAGGNIYCLGRKYNKKWRVGIQDPRKPGKIAYVLGLEDQASATSGDYEQYFIYKGKHYSHIIDPRTGYPADSGIISVTIIADNAIAADAISTAVFVLGLVKGLALLKKLGNIEAKIIEL